MPITDQVIRAFCGKIVNFVEQPGFTFGKEMQIHVMEIKANHPFASPVEFEETMQKAVTTLSAFLRKKFQAHLLGTGMHPFMRLNETRIWPHRHKKIYDTYGQIFDLQQQGWLNVQSFHLNLPYQKAADAAVQHNLLANVVPYLPAVSASSPIYEGALHEAADNRLVFYKVNQRQVPSVSGDIVPEYVSSLKDYRENIVGRYSRDLARVGVAESLLFKEWVNSRGVIVRSDRRALEIRVMDEQECVKSDVALSCFIRAALRGLLEIDSKLEPHKLLVTDFNAVLADGLHAKVQNPNGPIARCVCEHLNSVAWANANAEEKQYLPLIKKRIEGGSLSDLIRRDVLKRAQHTSLKEAIVTVYSRLIRCLETNEPYS